MRHRAMMAVGGMLSLWLIGMGWRHARPTPEALPRSLRPDTPYVLNFTNGTAIVDLECERQEQYQLILSQLDVAERTTRITVDTTARDKVTVFPEERVNSLRVVPLPALSPVAVPIRRVSHRLPMQSAEVSGGLAAAALPSLELANDLQNISQRVLPVGYEASVSRRDFFLHVTEGDLENPTGYVRILTRQLAAGPHCRVLCDMRQAAAPPQQTLADELVRLFEDEVGPRAGRLLGTHRDVDGDGKLTLLLTPWLGRMQGGEVNLNGLTSSSDFRPGVPAPFGNQCDVIYLNSQLRPGPMLRDLLAHEYAHAISFSVRIAGRPHEPSLPDEQDWLNEGIAHLAENLVGSGWTNLDYRISRYLDDPSRYPLIVGDYYRSGLWREHGCRGATYLFLRWCADQWGEGFAAAIMRSDRSGVQTVERVTGVPFSELYRQFTLALAASGAERSASPLSAESGASGARSTRQLLSVPLFGHVGGWQLAGPHWKTLSACDQSPGTAQPHTVSLKGTSTVFLRIELPSPGARRLRIRAPAGSILQATLIRTRPDAPRADFRAVWGESSVAAGATEFLLQVGSTTSPDLMLEAVCLEQNEGETRRTVVAQPRGAAVGTPPLRAAHACPPGGALRYSVPSDFLAEGRGPWRLKIVAEDPQGRKLAFHGSLPEHVSVPGPLAVRELPTIR